MTGILSRTTRSFSLQGCDRTPPSNSTGLHWQTGLRFKSGERSARRQRHFPSRSRQPYKHGSTGGYRREARAKAPYIHNPQKPELETEPNSANYQELNGFRMLRDGRLEPRTIRPTKTPHMLRWNWGTWAGRRCFTAIIMTALSRKLMPKNSGIRDLQSR